MDYHQPVLLSEVLQLFDPHPGQIIIDATLGHAGHTHEFLKKGATVYGIDADPTNIKISQQRLKENNLTTNFHPIRSDFSRLSKVIPLDILKKTDILFLDLGLNFFQLTSTGRGFSFNDPDSLDMRLNKKTTKLTAEYIINTYDFQQLFDLFSHLSQEQFSRPLALKIINERQKEPIRSGQRLANIVSAYYQSHHIKTHLHPATKIFMALRLAVNRDLPKIESVLKNSLRLFSPNSLVAIITFHSTEDRLVKQFIKKSAKLGLIKELKPIYPSHSEIKTNPPSRSAILRSYRILS